MGDRQVVITALRIRRTLRTALLLEISFTTKLICRHISLVVKEISNKSAVLRVRRILRAVITTWRSPIIHSLPSSLLSHTVILYLCWEVFRSYLNLFTMVGFLPKAGGGIRTHDDRTFVRALFYH